MHSSKNLCHFFDYISELKAVSIADRSIQKQGSLSGAGSIVYLLNLGMCDQEEDERPSAPTSYRRWIWVLFLKQIETPKMHRQSFHGIWTANF